MKLKAGLSSFGWNWFVILLLLALITHHYSRQDADQLQERAAKVLADLRQLQEQKIPESQTLLLLKYFEREESGSYYRGILQHVSLALFVSCFLFLAVEIHTRRAARQDMQRHLDEVTKNVFEGVAQRLLGERMTLELRAILLEDFVKTRAGYHITFEKSPDDTSDDWVVVRIESWYDVRNLTGEPADFPFLTSLLGYHREKVVVDGREVEFPHFVSVTIDGKDVPLSTLQDAENPLTLKRKIPLPKDMSAVTPFRVITRLLYKTKDSLVFSSSYAMESSAITVSNQVAHLVGKSSAVVLHKHTEQVTPRAEGSWEFSRALLPGQGWYVWWDRISDKGLTTQNKPQRHEEVTMTPSSKAENVTITPSAKDRAEVTITPSITEPPNSP